MYFVESLAGLLKWERTFDRFFSLSRPFIDFILETKVTTTTDVLTTKGNLEKWSRHVKPACDPFLSGASSVTMSLNNATVSAGDDFRVVDTVTTDQPYALSELNSLGDSDLQLNVTRNENVRRSDYKVDVYGKGVRGGTVLPEVELGINKIMTVVTMVSTNNNNLAAHNYEVYKGNDFSTPWGYIVAGQHEVSGTPSLFYISPTTTADGAFLTTDEELTIESSNHAISYAVHKGAGTDLGATLSLSSSRYTPPTSVTYRFVHHIYQELHHPLSKEWRDLHYFSCEAPFDANKAVEVTRLVQGLTYESVVTGRPRIAWYPSCASPSHEVQTLHTVETPATSNRTVSPVTTLTQTPSRIFVYVQTPSEIGTIYGAITSLRLRTAQYTQYAEYDQEALYRESVKNGSKQDRNGFFKGGPVILTMGPVQLERVQLQVEVTFDRVVHSADWRLYVTCEGVETLTLEGDGTKKRLLPDTE